MSLKQLFCKHDYHKVSHKINLLLGDPCRIGCYGIIGYENEILYRCNKCGKEKTKMFYSERRLET